MLVQESKHCHFKRSSKFYSEFILFFLQTHTGLTGGACAIGEQPIKVNAHI